MRNFLIFVLSLLPLSVVAHPGHDHAHWASSTLHFLFWAAILSVVVTLAAIKIRSLAKNHTREK